MSLRDATGRLAWSALTPQGYALPIGLDPALSNTVQEKITVMQMPYYIVCTLFTSNNKLQPLVWYLQDGTLPKDAPTAEKVLQQEGQYFLSGNNILYRQSNIGKRAVIQLVVLKTLQTELFHWCHDHFTSGYYVLNKTYERLRSTNFWNNMFADLQRRIKSCVSYAQ